MKRRELVLCGLLSALITAEGLFPAYAAGASVTTNTVNKTAASSEEASDSETETTEKASSGESGEASEKPAGEAPDGAPGGENGEAPEKPDGEAPDGAPGGENGEAPEKPDGEAPGGEMGQAPGGQGGPGGQAGGVESYDSVNEYTEDTTVEGETITSTGTDENAVLVSGEDASVTLDGVTVSRESEDSTGGDNSSFYGVGAALLATAGNLYVKGSAITTNAAGGAGVFAYGDSVVYVADTTIQTSQDTSGGIHAAGGGTLYAWDLDVTTGGESAAAIRSDRGGGTMVVDGGTYTSNGVGSPAVYCTADIAINNAQLTATGSEAVCIEGLNTLRLYDCDLTGNMSDLDQNDCTWNVIVYQSMSGDSEVGNGTFQMSGGTVTAQNGGLFYTTNTESTITLQNVEIIPAEENDFFLRCTGNNNDRGWGDAGNNGADCVFTGIEQEMEGDVIWDTISQLDFYMMDGSSLTGAFVEDETYSGGNGEGYCNVIIDENSTWIVTGDSTVSSLSLAGTIQDEEGQTVSVVGSDGTVYQEGDSQYTVTVDNYSDTADTTQAGVISEWTDHQVEKPEQLA